MESWKSLGNGSRSILLEDQAEPLIRHIPDPCAQALGASSLRAPISTVTFTHMLAKADVAGESYTVLRTYPSAATTGGVFVKC